MTELQKVQDQLNKALAELMKVNLDENELLYDYIFEAHRLAKQLILSDVSQQSELLAFRKWQKDNWKDVYLYSNEFMIREFKKANCG